MSINTAETTQQPECSTIIGDLQERPVTILSNTVPPAASIELVIGGLSGLSIGYKGAWAAPSKPVVLQVTTYSGTLLRCAFILPLS